VDDAFSRVKEAEGGNVNHGKNGKRQIYVVERISGQVITAFVKGRRRKRRRRRGVENRDEEAINYLLHRDKGIPSVLERNSSSKKKKGGGGRGGEKRTEKNLRRSEG